MAAVAMPRLHSLRLRPARTSDRSLPAPPPRWSSSRLACGFAPVVASPFTLAPRPAVNAAPPFPGDKRPVRSDWDTATAAETVVNGPERTPRQQEMEVVRT